MINFKITLVGAGLLCLGSHALFAQGDALKKHELYWTYNDIRVSLEDWASAFNEPSGKLVRRYIANKGYTSVLDIPCGGSPEYFGYKNDNIAIDYVGMDITQRLVDFALEKGINAKQGSIEAIPCADNSFDVCYARHIFEHLSYYEKAFDEVIRVAKKEVIAIFFIMPESAPDDIVCTTEKCSLLYNNRYDKRGIEEYIKKNDKVESFSWEILKKTTPYGDEGILHIYLKE